jgi:hypothetical protein
MLEILLMGVLVVAVYLIAHAVTQQAERWRGRPLGGWRSVIFFCVFLGLLLMGMQLIQLALAASAS